MHRKDDPFQDTNDTPCVAEGNFRIREADMHRLAILAAIAALLALPATADAAPKKKKPHATATHSAEVAAKPRPYPAHRYGGPWNQPWQSNQGWPTSINDGSFSYGGRGGF